MFIVAAPVVGIVTTNGVIAGIGTAMWVLVSTCVPASPLSLKRVSFRQKQFLPKIVLKTQTHLANASASAQREQQNVRKYF